MSNHKVISEHPVAPTPRPTLANSFALCLAEAWGTEDASGATGPTSLRSLLAGSLRTQFATRGLGREDFGRASEAGGWGGVCTPAKPLPAHFCPYSEPRRGWQIQGEPAAAAGTCGIRGTAERTAGVRQPGNGLSRRAGRDQEQRKTGS